VDRPEVVADGGIKPDYTTSFDPEIEGMFALGGGTYALRQLVTGTAAWDVDGYRPLPLRWVLVVDPTGQQPPAALFSTNLALSAPAIVELFVSRWSLKVTFEEARAHLGFQSQRQWSQAATTRTAPVILAMFSLVCLIAHRLHTITPVTPHSTAWYSKSDLTFADLLEAVRRCLWRKHIFPRPTFSSALALFSDRDREQLIQLLAAPF
jgi:hypothetical protein